jgi:hypothetical protein
VGECWVLPFPGSTTISRPALNKWQTLKYWWILGMAESFEMSFKQLSIKINKKVKNFPNFYRTEKADISDIT